MRYRNFLLLGYLSISGCVFAPGMQMDEYLSASVSIQPITADLIVKQDLQTKQRQKQNSNGRSKLQIFEKRNYEYRIGKRDVLSITVWDHPELTIPAGAYRSAEVAGHLVSEDGTIFYPYAGLVKVVGLTVGDVRKVLTQKISRTIAEPQLDVRVAAFRSQRAYVVGEVKQPGPQAISDIPLTIVEAINRAGGVSPDADMQHVTVSRKGKLLAIDLLATYEQGDVSQDIILHDADIVHIPDRNRQKVFVLGEVNKPSSYFMNKGRMTLAEAISDAGGVNQLSANPARIYVLRNGDNVPMVYHLNSSSPEALILGDKFKLLPRDVVYVDTAEVVRWNRVISNLLSTTTLLNNLSNIESQSFDDKNP